MLRNSRLFSHPPQSSPATFRYKPVTPVRLRTLATVSPTPLDGWLGVHDVLCRCAHAFLFFDVTLPGVESFSTYLHDLQSSSSQLSRFKTQCICSLPGAVVNLLYRHSGTVISNTSLRRQLSRCTSAEVLSRQCTKCFRKTQLASRLRKSKVSQCRCLKRRRDSGVQVYSNSLWM